jgi:peptidyl-prolyl cis-trans isomerase SurA
MGVRAGSAAPRRVLGAVFVWAALACGAGWGQVKVPMPHYQSPIEAPKPQVLAIPAPTAVTVDGTVVEYPIVRVNDQLIDKSDYERAQAQLVDEAQRSNLSADELAQRQKDLLREMIDQQLLLSRGKELDINADAEVIRQLDDIRKKNNLDSMEALQKAVTDSGISYEDFKANIKNQIITQQVVGTEVGRKLALTQKEEQAYYDQHKQDFVQPEQIGLSEILIPTADDATDAQVAQAQAKAEEVVAKLKGGAKFDDLAKQYSGGQTADKGGDLGEFKRGQLAKVLEDQTFVLQPGQWTAPIRTRQGYVVLKVTAHSPEGVQPLSAVDDQVKQAIYEQAIQPALRAYLTDLREKAYIDIAPGFVDTGASPKQTKPVYAAYTPPPLNKKKVEQKARLTPGKTAAKPAPGAATVVPAATTAVKVAGGKKPKKIRREKIRFGQAPRNSLPAAPEETAESLGTDQGEGATPASGDPAPGTAIAPIDEGVTTTVASDEDPLAPRAVEHKKTRYSDRAPIEAKAKAAQKAAKAVEKAAAVPAPLTTDEKVQQQTEDAPLGLGGDTATKKKKTKVKGAAKERIQEKAPTPPAPKPEATPIPPKSVRENGEPEVTPPPDPAKLPVVTPAPDPTTQPTPTPQQ